MLICTHCGKTYEGVLPSYNEVHGYTSMGNAITEKCYDTECPNCKNGELVLAKECSVCGEYFYDESHLNVCGDCLEDNTTLDVAMDIGEENKTDVYVNGFVKTLLGDEKINAILNEYVRSNYSTHIVKNQIAHYCNEDKSYFAEWVEYEAEHKV